MSITKFAPSEAKVLIRTHTATLNTWACNAPDPLTMPALKEALLATVSRIYELIEGLPEVVPPRRKLSS